MIVDAISGTGLFSGDRFHVHVGTERMLAVTVPSEAIQWDSNGAYVEVIRPDGKCEHVCLYVSAKDIKEFCAKVERDVDFGDAEGEWFLLYSLEHLLGAAMHVNRGEDVRVDLVIEDPKNLRLVARAVPNQYDKW